MKDFFVSYNKQDKAWAEWIAWTLEEAGYTVVIQAWDFRPGGNFVLAMQRASAECEKTIAVLSENYLKSEYAQSEWSAAFAGDPQSLKRKLIPVRVGVCKPEGVLKTIVYVDLVGVTADEAKALVLGALQERAKPARPPGFPGHGRAFARRTEPEPVTFPGRTPRAVARATTVSVQTRRQFLWLALGGAGVGGALLSKYFLSGAPSNPVSPTPVSTQRLPSVPSPSVSVSAIASSSAPSVPASTVLQPFKFDVVTVNAKGEQISKQLGQAQAFTEDLGNGIELDMVSIPSGSFQMGSPASEEEREKYEDPQHKVTIKPFLIGKYAVTQAQWKAIAALPQVKLELKPDPSFFKGDKRPVEQVSWNEAVEFCDRLSRKTGGTYRLSSEAEWEYACRTGTTTPFHFGETITTKLANYSGIDLQIFGNTVPGLYGQGPKGEYRGQTTDVGTFPPNAFGLYDMHGNVEEWCTDYWHDNYQGAPTDGSAWVTGGDSNYRVLRGGSWFLAPRFCRSASRGNHSPDYRSNGFGFRVVCSAP